jgi:hypothetical protein
MRDVIACFGETLEGEPLLRPVMISGRRTAVGRTTLSQARDYAARQLALLPSDLRALDRTAPPFEVKLAPRCRKRWRLSGKGYQLRVSER